MNIRKAVLSCFTPPFHLQATGRSLRILDANHAVIADFGNKGRFRIRAWGRIQYLKKSQEVFDNMCDFLNHTVAGVEHCPFKAIIRLNRAWALNWEANKQLPNALYHR